MCVKPYRACKRKLSGFGPGKIFETDIEEAHLQISAVICVVRNERVRAFEAQRKKYEKDRKKPSRQG